ncbi:TrlF family AAA-like ATPase [Pseudomonas lactis]|uniref:TrlF family AAA-like ATPase n=1 Tax=Pseudomonas lactis TaxID=1615674 RepID=UPI0014758C55|nr:AAA family ATPase [Pseudomonas lactis]NNA50290.1 AAA family ATPase [Pseudomonas lactis]
MSEILQGCMSNSNGARFYRGDLHIHSYQASHDVHDAEMTPEAIIATAVKENLSLIAVADHNEISNVQAAIKAGTAAGVLVIPAVELSTPEGHLLCYFPTIEALQQFHGRLNLAERGTANSRCSDAMLSCLDSAKTLGGFCILAHVDGGNGLEDNRPGGSPHKVDIICHPALLGIELKSAASTISYAIDDPEPVRAQIGKQRIEKLGLGARQYLARVLNSDSHTLSILGKNAAQDRKLTRYKMTAPTFDGLRHALQDNDSRVRLEDEVPTSTPFILGMTISGGFLSGQSIHFNSNLNCIIDGRGSGKSTAFEAVRCLSGADSEAAVVDSEVWPQQLHLFWQDEAGQQHSIARPLGGVIENLDDSIDGPIEFELDCFGQGEAGSVREQSKTDPLALLKYLDKFTRVHEALDEENSSIRVLSELREKIVKAEQNVALIPQAQRSLLTVKQQLTAFETAQGAEVIKLQRSLATEKSKREDLAEKLAELQAVFEETAIPLTMESIGLVVSDGVAVGADEAQEVISAIERFSVEYDKSQQLIKSAFTEFHLKISEAVKSWAAKEKPIRDEIDLKRNALEAQGVKLDMAYITRLTGEESKQRQALEKLEKWVPHLAALNISYAEALRNRWKSRKAVSNLRQTYAVKATRSLDEVLSDLKVKLQYLDGAYSHQAVAIISTAMGWRTSTQSKARALVEKLTVPGILTAVAKSQIESVTAIEVSAGVKMFSTGDAKELFERLKDPSVKASLEQCEIDDYPKLTVSRVIADEKGVRHVQRDFSLLSLGQQQSVLLALILSSDSKRPLIIDQPEDNLDSEFIFQTFVPVLRRAKERRQVIIVTHNANIAVLGDAEQLIVFKSNSEQSKIVARGSIDDPEAREAACKILEGAREAFTRRAKIYGVSA